MTPKNSANTAKKQGKLSRVWVAPGCVQCGLCEEICPDVFELSGRSVKLRSDVDLGRHEQAIREVARYCPVQVVQLEEE